MSIQIIIEGKHSIDVLAELENLASALTGNDAPFEVSASSSVNVITEPTKEVEEGMRRAAELSNAAMKEVAAQNVEAAKSVIEDKDEPVEKKPKSKKLKGVQHKIEADRMIAEGKKDEMYSYLSFTQKTRVDNALKGSDVAVTNENVASQEVPAALKSVVDKSVDKPVDNLFDDEASGVNATDIRDIINKTCRDSKGTDIPEKYAAVRSEMRKVIPDNLEVKMSNIPTDKYDALYASIKAI